MALQRSLLTLPAEIRSKIWMFCVDSIDETVTMCPCELATHAVCKHTFSSCTAVEHHSARSCEADYAERAVYTTALNLIFVSEQLRSEAQYLYSSKLLKFCSRPCFADLLKTLGPHYGWVRNIEIAIDLRPLRVGYSYSSARYLEMLGDEKQRLCDFASEKFSSRSFEGREIWKGFDVTGSTRHEYIVHGTLVA